MSRKPRSIRVADTPVKNAFTELEAFERDNSIEQGTERRKELRGNVLASLGLSPALVERDRVNRAFDVLYRECRHPSGDIVKRVRKERSNVAGKARAEARRVRTEEEKAVAATLVAVSGN